MVIVVVAVGLVTASCSAQATAEPERAPAPTSTTALAEQTSTTSTTTTTTTEPPPTTTTTAPPPTVDALIDAVNEWMSERTGLGIDYRSETSISDGTVVRIVGYSGEGSLDGGFAADTNWWSFGYEHLALPRDDGGPIEAISPVTDIEIDGIAYHRDISDGLWSIDTEHDHTGSASRALFMGEFVLTGAEIAKGDATDNETYELTGVYEPALEEMVTVVATRDGHVLEIRQVWETAVDDLWFGEFLPEDEDSVRIESVLSITKVDPTLGYLVPPPLTNMGIDVGNVLDVAAEAPSASDTWYFDLEPDDPFAFLSSSDDAAVGLMEFDEPGITLDDLAVRRLASFGSEIVNLSVSETTTLQGYPTLTITYIVEGEESFMIHDLLYVNDKGGAILTVLMGAEPNQDMVDLAVYVHQSFRVVTADEAAFYHSEDIQYAG